MHSVIGVFALCIVDGNARKFGTHFCELRNKWAVKVYRLTVVEGIKFIAPKTVFAVDRERFICGVNRNKRLFAHVTGTYIVTTVVAEH